jgi:hypothetical protein
MDHRTVHDLDLELQRIKSDLRRIEQEGGDVDSHCADIADNDPVLYCWLLAELFPGEMSEAMQDAVRDRPWLLDTIH